MADAPSDPPTPDRADPGGLADLGDLGGLLESAQEAFSAQARAAEEVVTGSAGGGVVTVEMSGAGEVRSIRLAPEVVDPEDVEMLQDLIVSAVGEAIRDARELEAQKMGALTAGLGIPGLG
jgi:nucleoid-associated protein EbfC